MKTIELSSYKEVTIKEGNHYPVFLDTLWTITSLPYKPLVIVKFTEKSKYNMFGDVDQHDWNKLYGRLGYAWREGKLIRLEQWYVWRYFAGQIQVAKYRREGTEFKTHDVTNVNLFEDVFLSNDWFTLPLPLGTYFGGHDSDSDGIGGVAPQTVKLYFA